jgi:hypothetical protein
MSIHTADALQSRPFTDAELAAYVVGKANESLQCRVNECRRLNPELDELLRLLGAPDETCQEDQPPSDAAPDLAGPPPTDAAVGAHPSGVVPIVNARENAILAAVQSYFATTA